MLQSQIHKVEVAVEVVLVEVVVVGSEEDAVETEVASVVPEVEAVVVMVVTMVVSEEVEVAVEVVLEETVGVEEVVVDVGVDMVVVMEVMVVEMMVGMEEEVADVEEEVEVDTRTEETKVVMVAAEEADMLVVIMEDTNKVGTKEVTREDMVKADKEDMDKHKVDMVVNKVVLEEPVDMVTRQGVMELPQHLLHQHPVDMEQLQRQVRLEDKLDMEDMIPLLLEDTQQEDMVHKEEPQAALLQHLLVMDKHMTVRHQVTDKVTDNKLHQLPRHQQRQRLVDMIVTAKDSRAEDTDSIRPPRLLV